ncbi:MAG: tetratricopeptide repeat protein [Oceanococcus sp.]
MPIDLRLIFSSSAILALSACALVSPEAEMQSDFDQRWQSVSENPTVTVHAGVLAGELAAKRGLPQEAAQLYLQAAQQSQDPLIAQRATQLALQAENIQLASLGANRWIDLDAENTGAYEIAARLALRQQKYTEAQGHLKKLLDLDKSPDGAALVNVAEILSLEPEAADQALSLYRELIERQPITAAAAYAEALLAYRVDRPAQAGVAVDKALMMRPDWQQAQLLALRLQLQAGDGAAAERSIQDLHVSSPKSLKLRLSLGSLLLEFEQTALATREFRNALKIDKNNAAALFALGLIAMDAGELSKAEEYFTRLQNQGQRLADSSFYLGRIAEEQGDALKAMQFYREVSSGRRVLDAAIRQTVIISKQGELSAARSYLEILRARFPNEVLRLWQVEAELLFRDNQDQAALEIYNQALDEYPEDIDLLYGRAIVFERLGRVDEAEADLRAVIAQDGDDARSLNALGYMLSNHSERYAEATALVRRALVLTPDDPAVIDSLGWLYFRQGDLTQARLHLEQAWDRLKDPEVAAHLGEVLWRQGEQERARSVWLQGLQQNPGHQGLLQTMERLDSAI